MWLGKIECLLVQIGMSIRWGCIRCMWNMGLGISIILGFMRYWLRVRGGKCMKLNVWNSMHVRTSCWRTTTIIPLTSSSSTSCTTINLSIPRPTSYGYRNEISQTWSSGWSRILWWIFLFKASSVRPRFVWKNVRRGHWNVSPSYILIIWSL